MKNQSCDISALYTATANGFSTQLSHRNFFIFLPNSTKLNNTYKLQDMKPAQPKLSVNQTLMAQLFTLLFGGAQIPAYI